MEREVGFVDTGGELPPLWSRRVIFFANLLALFYGNDEQTLSLRDEVGEIDSYSARLIPILNLLFQGEDNVLVLEREPDARLCAYLQDDLGLSLPRMQVMLHSDYVQIGQQLSSQSTTVCEHLVELKSGRFEWIDGYVTDGNLAAIADHLGCQTISSQTASRDGNNKLLIHQHLANTGLPTFDTTLAASSSELKQCVRELRSLGYESAVIRAQIGASGIGMLRLPDLKAQDLPEIPSYFFYEGPCMVQGWLEPGVCGVTQIKSPSTQLFVDDTHIYAYDNTEQILSQYSIHQGNVSPPPYLEDQPQLREEMMRQSAVAGRWLHSTGYRGTASIDWLLVNREDQTVPDLYVCEINARVTGATYPSLLARHFHPSGAWLLRNLRLRIPISSDELFDAFETPGHLFHPGRRAGILPLNLNFGPDNLVHKGQFLCIGSTTDECQRFLDLAEQDLPIEWHDDRD